VSPNTAGHSTSVLRSPLGARAFGAPTVPRAPAPDRNSGNHPVPQTPAPSGGGLGWGRVANHCRTRSSYTLLVSIATSWGGGVSQNIAGHSTSVLRSPLGARASGAPTVSHAPAPDRDSGNRPAPATSAPSGGGWGWGRVANHCRTRSSYTLLVSIATSWGGGVSQITAGHSTSVLRSPLGARASGAPTVPRAPAPDRNSGNHPVPQTPAPSGGGWGWGRVANHCRPQHQRATRTTGSARLRRANSVSHPYIRS
jgi:hypothetical protein